MKICSKCKIEKDIKYFNKDKKSKDGCTYWCKECLYGNNNIWVKSNSEYHKNWYKLNPDYYKEKYLIHKLFQPKFTPKTKDQKREYIRNYQKNKKLIDPLYNFSTNLRVRINHAFRRTKWKKEGKTEKLLGCNFEFGIKHIENLFTEGMNWGNYGKWHIDHIIPLSSAKNEEELTKLCHYTNLQPLWASDNIIKGKKFF